jgi:molybdopterin synthase sulfur carrier subunit
MDSQSAILSVTVILPHVLRTKVGNRKSVTVTGNTIREVIQALDRDYPGLEFNICYETGELRPYVNIFLNRESIRYLQDLDTPVTPGAIVHILQSVAGGEYQADWQPGKSALPER